MHISGPITLTDYVLGAVLATLDYIHIRVPVGLWVVVFTSVQRSSKYHARWLIQTAAPHVFGWVIIELIPILPLDLVGPLIVAVL